MTVRTMVLWCPDWPVTASGRASGADGTSVPVVVVRANRVVVASAAARSEGVRVGQRRRQAEAACPGLVVVEHDPDRDARAFEPVVRSVADFCPLVEVMRPGLCGFAVRGPARYFGGEEALAQKLINQVIVLVPSGCRVGVADGPFAGVLAARRGVIVAPGETPAFLAPLPVRELGRPELADLFGRLGVATLGQLADLPAPQVLSRFGWEGAEAHRLARGLDERPLAAARPAEDLSVEEELDPPVERVDAAAFLAKALADRLYERLVGGGWRCLLVRIEAESEHGESLSRTWRHDGSFTAASLGERVRWQLDGWLLGTHRPTAGLTRLKLTPEEVVPDQGTQSGFWGGMARADAEAARVLGRLQGLLGPEGVFTAVLEGGRSPVERSRLVPWGDERSPGREPERPWPGRAPGPAPAVARPGPSGMILDESGQPVIVLRRGVLTGAPSQLQLEDLAPMGITGWSAPWPGEERWWDPVRRRRRVWMQVSVEDGQAFLLSAEQGQWSVEAVYD
jgi:protein ImuB